MLINIQQLYEQLKINFVYINVFSPLSAEPLITSTTTSDVKQPLLASLPTKFRQLLIISCFEKAEHCLVNMHNIDLFNF